MSKTLYEMLLDSGMDEAEAAQIAIEAEQGYLYIEALDPNHRAEEDREHTATNIYRRPNE